MKTIWKYPFKVDDRFTLEIPARSEVIHVGLDPEGNRCLWILLDPEDVKYTATFYIFGTGHNVDSRFQGSRHVGSFIEGPFVWHVFQ